MASKHSAGLTLVEVIAVLVILGIVAAVAAPRFLDDRAFLARGYYDELVAALRYAQKLAVASGCPVRMRIDAGGYTARRPAADDGHCAGAPPGFFGGAPPGDAVLLSGTSPVGIAASPSVTLTFDALGRLNLAADQSIAVGPFPLTLRAAGNIEAL